MTPVAHIAIPNYAAPTLDTELALTVDALRNELPRFCASWSIPLPGIAFYGYDRSTSLTPGERAVVCVVSSTGDHSAFARHSQLGAEVFGYVDAETCRAGGEPIPRAISHEVFELLADPGLDQVETQADGTAVLREVCDAVNRQGFTVDAEFFGRHGAVPLANYLLPSWFRNGAAPFDRAGVLEHALEDGPFGHHQVVRNGVVVTSGSLARVSSFGRTFRRMAGAGARIG